MTSWKALAKPDCPYFGEQDFSAPDEIKTVTIARHNIEQVQNESGKSRKGVLHFMEAGIKPLILNVTNSKAIAKLYGKNADGWIGKQIALYFDASVRFGREIVGGVRVKAPVVTKGAPICSDCGGAILPVGKMSAEQTATYTKTKYGRPLCGECAKKEAAARAADEG